uniref:rRNA biogenesis protein RRP36 n=1 Tax=Nothoprocta perdicaria TaxID=30464 RepID=A0A8C6YZ20_NOTPE
MWGCRVGSASRSCLLHIPSSLSLPDLSYVSFEELLQMQNGMGMRTHRVTAGKKTAHPAPSRVFSFRPLEMSAKKRVPFLRRVVPVTKKVGRDPRFDDLSGEYNPEIFLKTYGFLDSIKKREKEMVQKQLKKCRNVEEKEKLQQLLRRMELFECWCSRDKPGREQQGGLGLQRFTGFSLNLPSLSSAAEKRKLELAEKYAELKRSGKLESFLSKKRKRNAIKDKRRLPSQKSL